MNIKNLGEIYDIEAFIKTIKDNQPKEGERLFFRGQASEKRLPEPYVFRTEDDTNYCYRGDEKSYYYEALRRHPQEFSGLSSIDKLAKMQHYGWPTRLLDFTTNPLVALFFACKKHETEGGSVFIYKARKEEKGKQSKTLSFDSVRALMLACLPRLDAKEQETIKQFVKRFKKPNENQIDNDVIIALEHLQNGRDNDDVVSRLYTKIKGKIDKEAAKDIRRTLGRLIYEITCERPPFEKHNIVPSDLLESFIVMPQVTNERMKVQSGCFCIFGLDDCNLDFYKIIIKSEQDSKKKILRDLDLLGINEDSIFGDLDSSAEYVINKFKEL